MVPGEFNNFEQHEVDLNAKEKEGKDIKPHAHMHSIFAPVRIDGFDGTVFHVQQSDGHNLKKIFRMRLYAFSDNNADGDIELSIYKYPKGGDYFDAHKHPVILKALRKNRLKDTGCVVSWKKEGENFTATGKHGHCKIYSPYFKKNIIVKDQIILTRDQIWILDNIYDEQGKLIMGRKDGIPRKLKRCRFYKGWAAIRKAEADKLPKDKSKYISYFSLILHDQGQRPLLKGRDGKIADFKVSLAQLTYGGSHTKVLKLGVHNKGEKKTKLYIWGEPTAPRLGIDAKWIQTGFTLVQGLRFSK